MTDRTHRYRRLETPAGPFALIRSAAGELSAAWLDESLAEGGLPAGATSDPHLLPELSARLVAYFAGEGVSFDDVPTPRGSSFHRRCWAACRSIPPGQTRTYGQLAAMAGSPRGARAAGGAMRSNPLPVIVPCHRVVGTDGDLGGYGGNQDPASREIAIKRTLLELER